MDIEEESWQQAGDNPHLPDHESHKQLALQIDTVPITPPTKTETFIEDEEELSIEEQILLDPTWNS